jgi:hypothetical protein
MQHNCCSVACTVAAYVIITQLLIKYQQALHIKYSTWVTVVAMVLLAWAAAQEAFTNGFPSEFDDEQLEVQGSIFSAWLFIQVFLIIYGVIRKVLVPCAIPSCPHMQCAIHFDMAVHTSVQCSSIWIIQRLPANAFAPLHHPKTLLQVQDCTRHQLCLSSWDSSVRRQCTARDANAIRMQLHFRYRNITERRLQGLLAPLQTFIAVNMQGWRRTRDSHPLR